MSKRIKHILTVFTSARDINGNTYHAAEYVRASDGKRVRFVCPARSNAESAIYHLNGNVYGNTFTIETVLTKREFNSLTKDWPYFHCTGEDIAKSIKKALRKGTQ